MRVFGLIGFPLEHSFSERWFNEAFQRDGIEGVVYRNFPIADIGLLPQLFADNPDLEGFNVTSPYKEAVLPYLDGLSPEAKEIGAVNCVVRRKGKLYGYNTDHYGFRVSAENFLSGAGSDFHSGACSDFHSGPYSDCDFDSGDDPCPCSCGNSDLGALGRSNNGLQALVLGSGGAAKAVRYALGEMSIPYLTVTSREGRQDCLRYDGLTPEIIASHLLIINATPLGTYPDTQSAPPFPYELLSPRHFLYDLVYNPAVTTFLSKGAQAGASAKNGHEMLVLQAEKSRELFGI